MNKQNTCRMLKSVISGVALQKKKTDAVTDLVWKKKYIYIYIASLKQKTGAAVRV